MAKEEDTTPKDKAAEAQGADVKDLDDTQGNQGNPAPKPSEPF